MSTATPTISEPPTRRLARGPAFAFVAVVVASLLGASAAPTPIYEVYERDWGFSSLQSTTVFGIYALSLLAALLTVGSLSDHVGRRPVLFVALAVEAASMVVFAAADGVGLLLVARVVQGFATGAAISALGSLLIDLERRPGRGAVVNSMAPGAGLALGALASSLVSEHLPRPTTTVYLLLLVLFVAETAVVAALPETVTRRPGALATLRPSLAVPASSRTPMLLTAPCLVAVWALGGFYLSLGPTLAHNALDVHSSLVGAIMVALLTGTGAVTVFVLRNSPAQTVLAVGSGALVAGVAVTLVGAEESSALLVLAGTVVAGAGFGAGFQGTIRTVMPTAGPSERAGLLASVYVVAYLANSVPAFGAGYLVTRIGVTDTTRLYGGLVIVLAAVALAASVLRRPVAAAAQTD
ncbi:MFS transporter [Rhodococcus sp. HNM0569]|uniref:MFS transporter n=1 Tax=Rhodococcus sp. HNM0569 TaxID=2716340 RepID=UPI00146C3744|nr:MFS transporter [Rhodococcus sp. HNM0569]NLU82452.1 MFS transporter [Rhodococcus sp. HNM0569]